MMDAPDLFHSGAPAGIHPKADSARQGVDALRGYIYQALAAAVAWVDIDDEGRLYLEVAEDYATVANQALEAVQVKDTGGSGPVTLNSKNVQEAIKNFVKLFDQNPNLEIGLRFFTTSEIGTEHKVDDRPAGTAGLKYWRKVAAGADPSPLRAILQGGKFPESVRAFCKSRSDAELRRDLFARIHWDCGQPDSSTLRKELKARLIVIGRDRFSLPSHEAPRLVDHLVCRVLEKSIFKEPQERVLTRAELYGLIDELTLTSVPRRAFDEMASNLLGGFGGAWSSQTPISIVESAWFVEGAELPSPLGVIARPHVESQLANALATLGIAILVGGSGLGKSILSRAVAKARTNSSFIAECRNTHAGEARHRLDMVFGRIGGLPTSILILEDLNHFEDKRVILSLARVIEASRRRDREVLITCYRKPDMGALAEISLDQRCVVQCPYLSEEETWALVRNRGGDPKTWGRLAYLAGELGHPQLTHAFVSGVAARGWPIEEFDTAISRGLESQETVDTRSAVRRSLKSTLPEPTRDLLYRLSLTRGRFTRSLALAIGGLHPQISRPGECLDELIGPWIEGASSDLFRVSPLASNLGRDILLDQEQKQVHTVIATQTLKKGAIDAVDANNIIMHGIAGESAKSLLAIALSVLRDDLEPHVLEMLSEHLLVLRLFRTDVPIYPPSLPVSVMLRMAQFRLTIAAGKTDRVPTVTATLFKEIEDIPEGESRDAAEARAMLTVLGTKGVANYLDDWLFLLLRLRDKIKVNEFLKSLRANSNVLGLFFSIGSANLISVARLEHVIDKLDELDTGARSLLLEPIYTAYADYAVFLNSPWLTGHREGFDARDAAVRYQRLAEKTRGWGNRLLTLQCSIAQATMLDEYENDKGAALEVLEEARRVVGDDLILSRAEAKVHWRHGDNAKALQIYHCIAEQVGGDNPVERAYALREAAISSAKCGEWPQAERWFLEAQHAAARAPGDCLRVMAIGLGADSAVAAVKTGLSCRGLERLARALAALKDVDPDSTLSGVYCHHAVRRAVVWIKSIIEDGESPDQPIDMEPGICSNPDPPPEIRDRPLTHTDTAWYILAETETTAGLDAQIRIALHDRLTQGPIPVMEASLRTRVLQMDIRRLNAGDFAAHLTPYIEVTTHLLKEPSLHQDDIDPLTPKRGQAPKLGKWPPFDPVAEQASKQAIMAYGIYCAIEKQPAAMTDLEIALRQQFAGPFPGEAIFEYWNTESTTIEELEQTILDTIRKLVRHNHVDPFHFWAAGLYFFKWINQSNFKHFLTTLLATWLRTGWNRIVIEERFRLSLPLQTVPPIEDALTIPANDRRFIANILIAASGAVGASLGPVYRHALEAMAEEVESP